MRRMALLLLLVTLGCAHVQRSGHPGWTINEMSAAQQKAGIAVGIRRFDEAERRRFFQEWVAQRDVTPVYIMVRNTTADEWLVDAHDAAYISEQILTESQAETGSVSGASHSGTLTLLPGVPLITVGGVAAVTQAPLDHVYMSDQTTRVTPGHELRGVLYLRSLNIYDHITVRAMCPATGQRLDFTFTGGDLRGQQMAQMVPQPGRPRPRSAPNPGRAPARGDGAYSTLAIALGAWRACIPEVGEVASGIVRPGCELL